MPKKINVITKEQLEDAYVSQEKSMKEIALEFGCSAQTICNLLHRYEIQTRDGTEHTERTKEKIAKQMQGESHQYYGKKRPEHSELMKGRKPYVMTDEVRNKMAASAKGKKLSDQTKQKISEAAKGKIVSDETRAKLAIASTGRLHTAETKRKMSEAKNGKWGGKYIGKDHPNWKPIEQRLTPLYRRIRSSKRMEDWRKAVFERDNWTCQHCGVRGGVLNADHIQSFADICDKYAITTLEEAKLCEKLWDTQNGRTLCLTCHKKTDTFGKHHKRSS